MPRPSEERRLGRLTDLCLLALGAAYLLVVFIEFASRCGEIYPIASWSLFSRVPNEVHDYGLTIVRAGGREFDPPLNFEDAAALFPAAGEANARSAIGSFGESLIAGDQAGIGRSRSVVEGLFLGGRGRVVYEIVERRFDPLERARTRGFRQIRPLGRFEFTAGVSR